MAAGLTPAFGEQIHANTIELESHHELRPSSPLEDSKAQQKPRKTVDLEDDDVEFIPAPITESHHYVENVLLLRPKVGVCFPVSVCACSTGCLSVSLWVSVCFCVCVCVSFIVSQFSVGLFEPVCVIKAAGKPK